MMCQRRAVGAGWEAGALALVSRELQAPPRRKERKKQLPTRWGVAGGCTARSGWAGGVTCRSHLLFCSSVFRSQVV
jgi:hypothetical protein